ncbi:hypothetical protein, partial [Persicitalea sp.]|uniref:hypothetical protein n=1 Tax=Persicitalea sp. TaxID=3100273 RepID=UPI003593EE25
MRKNYLLFLLLIACGNAFAQTNFFEPLPVSNLREDVSVTKHIKKLTLYSIKESQLRQHLLKAPLEFSSRTSALTLEIPLPNGQTETFEMFESP